MKELDQRLRDFIAQPDHFLASLALVEALHRCPVYARSAYAVSLEGQKFLPVFTTRSDCEAFKLDQPGAGSGAWVEEKPLALLKETIGQGLTGLAFNLKNSGNFANSTLFKTADMISFINYYSDLINQVLSDLNQARDWQGRVYFVPAFVEQTGPGLSNRHFPSFIHRDGQVFLPVFSKVSSLEAWYNHPDHGSAFRQAKGAILAWNFKDIEHPLSGSNDLTGLAGLLVDPWDQEKILYFKS